MTTEEHEPKTIAKPKSDGGDEILVFSAMHYPLNGTIWEEPETPGARSNGVHWNLQPGDNYIRRDVWEKVAKLEAIVSRLDHGDIKVSHTSTMLDAERLLEPAPRSLIRRLSARATRIEDGQDFGAGAAAGASPEARLRQLEAQIRKMQG